MTKQARGEDMKEIVGMVQWGSENGTPCGEKEHGRTITPPINKEHADPTSFQAALLLWCSFSVGHICSPFTGSLLSQGY